MDFRELMLEQKRLILDNSAILDTSHLGIVRTKNSNIRVANVTAQELEEWVKKYLPQELLNIFRAIEIHPKVFFEFYSFDELYIHLKIRRSLIERMIQLENAWGDNGNSIANYPGMNGIFNLPVTYWQFMNIPGADGFITRSKVKMGEAIASLMQSNNGIILDCNRMSVALAYVAIQDAIGGHDTNRIFLPDNEITLGTWHDRYDAYGRITLLSKKYYKAEDVYSDLHSDSSANLCLPGDIVYFRNDPTYKLLLTSLRVLSRDTRNEIIGDPRFDAAWTGEYCVCTSQNKFSGFGLRHPDEIELTSRQVRKDLLTKATSLYDLFQEKANFIFEKQTIEMPNIENVILDKKCYRINTSEIIKIITID